MVPRRRLLLGLILVLGAALRLALYLSRPSLSIDETMIGLEIGTRSFGGLVRALDYAQTGPPLFLWATKLAAVVAGMSEYALRIIPLTAGLVLPYLTWRVGRRMLEAPHALLATAIAAAAPTLVQYSVIAKPYITDGLVALVLALCTLRVLERPQARGPWMWLGVAGLAAVLGSVPAPFLLAGVATALLLGVRPLMPAALRLGACVAAWGAAFLPLYLRLYRPVAASDYMQQFWGDSFFAPARVEGWGLLGRVAVQSLAARPIPVVVILPIVVLLGGGLWALARRNGRAIAALLGVPLLLLLGASLVHRYPLSARLLLAIVPTLALCAAAGVAALVGSHRRIGWTLGGLLVAALAAVNLSHPYRTPALRPAVIALRVTAAPTDPIYVSSGALPAWAFYSTDWSAPDTAYLRRIRDWAGDPEAPAYHNLAPRGRAVTASDGQNLELRRSDRLEIIGLASGIQWREVSGLTGRAPDAGWAEREAERIRGTGPVAWLLIANAYAETATDLLAALRAAGGHVDVDSAEHGARRVRVRFAP